MATNGTPLPSLRFLSPIPLKAIAEFVENSIDAHAKKIVITRGKEGGDVYLRIEDDGDGIPKNENGEPDFHYVATHICDSLKRRMKEKGAKGLQGEFGIGLLSFWTVGDALTMSSTGADGRSYEMTMTRGEPGYSLRRRQKLFSKQGTELKIKPLLPGNRQLSGQKLQWYLASELRDRIRSTGVEIRIVDRLHREELIVEPRQYAGELLHSMRPEASPFGEIYCELYLTSPSPENQISLTRLGTRVFPSITELEDFRSTPWNSPYLQGVIDVPFLHLTPGSRLGILYDQEFDSFVQSLKGLERPLQELIETHEQAEEEQASRETLRTIQKAFREAMLSLPPEDYDWFKLQSLKLSTSKAGESQAESKESRALTEDFLSDFASKTPIQKSFFDYSGPLYRAQIVPASCLVRVGETRNFAALPRDRQGKRVDRGDLQFEWELIDGGGAIENTSSEHLTFKASEEPGISRLRLRVRQNDVICEAEGIVTVVDTLLPEKKGNGEQKGLPNYTFQKAPGELWRSRYDFDQNVILINSGHRDFIHIAAKKTAKLRYICRLFCKEMILKNFPGMSANEVLERMVELSLHTEEHL